MGAGLDVTICSTMAGCAVEDGILGHVPAIAWCRDARLVPSLDDWATTCLERGNHFSRKPRSFPGLLPAPCAFRFDKSACEHAGGKKTLAQASLLRSAISLLNMSTGQTSSRAMKIHHQLSSLIA